MTIIVVPYLVLSYTRRLVLHYSYSLAKLNLLCDEIRYR